MPISWLSSHLNTVYTTEEKENFNPMDMLRKARTVVGFPLLVPNMETRSFETVMNPIYPVVMNFSMSKYLMSESLFMYMVIIQIIIPQPPTTRFPVKSVRPKPQKSFERP